MTYITELFGSIFNQHFSRQDILENIPVGLIKKNSDLQIEYANKFILNLLNIASDEIYSLKSDEQAERLFPLTPQEYRKLIQFEQLKEPFKVRVQAKTYPEIWLEVTATYADTFILETFTEVTELVRFTRVLQQKKEDLETFAKILSHDVKGCLFGIKGYTSILKELNLPEEALSIIDGLSRSQDKLERLVKSTLDFYKAIKTEFPPEKINLEDIVSEVVSSFVDDFERVGGKIFNEVQKCWVIASSAVLKIALTNLLSNALKYRASDRALVVSLTAELEKSQIILKVKDNGIGLKESQLPDLFKPFNRFHSGISGEGLGLALVHNILAKVDCQINCTINNDQGLTFAIIIPKA